jgi:hypothetical protein
MATVCVALCAAAGLAAAGSMNVWVAPDTCKVNPTNGNVLEEHYFCSDPDIAPPGYVRRKMRGAARNRSLPYYAADSYGGPTTGKLRLASPIWDARAGKVTLRAGRNEFAAFQIVIENTGAEPLRRVRCEVAISAGPAKFDSGGNVRLFRQYYMHLARKFEDSWNMTGPSGKAFWYPEVLVPTELPGQSPFAIPDAKLKVNGQRNQAVWVDLYVPHKQKPGAYTGSIRVVAAGVEPVQIDLALKVLPLTLPDKLTFWVDMMSSARPIAGHWRLGLKNPAHVKRYLAIEKEFYRIFAAHRCTLNMFPGCPTREKRTPEQVIIPTFAPPLTGKGENIRVADWSKWDAHFGRYLTGEAFEGLPRGPRPVTHQFLPFSLGWPSNFQQYRGDRATYETEFKKILRDFAVHLAERGWTRTQFQFFLNGKRKFGEPWDTDEPTRKSDYAALRYYGEMTRDALGPRGKRKANIVYRVDIGTPQRMPGELDEVCDLRNVNYEAYNRYGFFWSPFRRKQEAAGEIWWYYAADRANQRWARTDWSMASSLIWAWAMWDLDVRACCKCPVRNPATQWNYCTYAYPGTEFGYDGPLPGLKLKALRRGLQDMEYLAMLAARDGGKRRANAILRKYYAAWDRRTRKPRPPGSVRVGPDDPYRLRDDVLKALLGE